MLQPLSFKASKSSIKEKNEDKSTQNNADSNFVDNRQTNLTQRKMRDDVEKSPVAQMMAKNNDETKQSQHEGVEPATNDQEKSIVDKAMENIDDVEFDNQFDMLYDASPTVYLSVPSPEEFKETTNQFLAVRDSLLLQIDLHIVKVNKLRNLIVRSLMRGNEDVEGTHSEYVGELKALLERVFTYLDDAKSPAGELNPSKQVMAQVESLRNAVQNDIEFSLSNESKVKYGRTDTGKLRGRMQLPKGQNDIITAKNEDLSLDNFKTYAKEESDRQIGYQESLKQVMTVKEFKQKANITFEFATPGMTALIKKLTDFHSVVDWKNESKESDKKWELISQLMDAIGEVKIDSPEQGAKLAKTDKQLMWDHQKREALYELRLRCSKFKEVLREHRLKKQGYDPEMFKNVKRTSVKDEGESKNDEGLAYGAEILKRFQNATS